jgi:hypothetical protein
VTIAVDFDGVIHAYSKGWHDGSIYDPPLPGAIEGLGALMAGDAVFIFTTRDADPVARWLRRQGVAAVTETEVGTTIPVFWNERGRVLVTNRKLPAVVYLDDRAVRFAGWPQALAAIKDAT